MSLVRIDLTNVRIDQIYRPALDIAVKGALQTTLLVLKDEWQRQVQRKLRSTRNDYLLGLDFNSIQYPYNGNPFSGAVVLQGKWPNMLEHGFAPFDIKKGMEKSSKVKHKADGGWYITVPFRHSTPNGVMYGRPMPVDIHARAKRLPSMGTMRVGGTPAVSWTGYQHKAVIYDNMQRITKQYAKSRQSQYFTFRRISDKSDPMSWMHRGYAGVKISDTLNPIAERTFKQAFDANLKHILG